MDTNENDAINRRYLLHNGDDPTKMLAPIWGYAREPLVSLKEACIPLHSIVSRLEPHIWVAMENSKNPSDNLTQDESAAIHLYTMEWEGLDGEINGSLYKHLNRTLKEIDRSGLRPWFRYLKLFLTALAKIPISHRHIIWRGVHLDLSSTYIPGTQVTWWPLSSCTTSLNVLESDLYLGNVGTRTLFSIEALNGRTIRDHSHFTTEDEILLLPGTYLEVLSQLNPAPGLYIIHLQQIRPPHELLEPSFKGALLLPPSTDSEDLDTTIEIFENKNINIQYRSWYKKKKIWISFSIAIILIIMAIILGSVLGSRKTDTTTTTSSPIITPPFIFNASTNRTLQWASDEWNVRNEQNSYPGSSNWTSNNVVLDSSRPELYMRLTHDTFGNWWCAEVESQRHYSFGTFTFFINARIDKFDPNVVLRLFTKGSNNQTNQIIIEIGRRGQITSSAQNLWYTIYPNAINQSISSKSSQIPTLNGTYTTHRINWMTDTVTIEAEHDNNRQPNFSLGFNYYSTNILWAPFVPQVPAPVIISLCTYNGTAPMNGQEVEVNIRLFSWS